jgi:hypothetical protein
MVAPQGRHRWHQLHLRPGAPPLRRALHAGAGLLVRRAEPPRNLPGEQDAALTQKLGQLQPFIAALPVSYRNA